MRAVEARRLFEGMGCDPGTVWLTMRILRERGYLPAGKGGQGGVNSAVLSSHNLAVIIAALAHPKGIKLAIGDMGRMEPGALRQITDLIEGTGAPAPVKVWHLEDGLGVHRVSVVPSDLICRIGVQFRRSFARAA